MICFFNKYKKSVQKHTDFFDNSFFNAVPDKPLATRNKSHNNQLCAGLSRLISAYPVVSHFLRFAWQTTRGRQEETKMLLDLIDISIHALVKRATTVPNGRCTSPVISIHALVKRATTFYIRFKRIYPYFNPRPREEGDKCGRRSFRLEVYFNPRPREEGDSTATTSSPMLRNFNPRPREEGGATLQAGITLLKLFQSTPS